MYSARGRHIQQQWACLFVAIHVMSSMATKAGHIVACLNVGPVRSSHACFCSDLQHGQINEHEHATQIPRCEVRGVSAAGLAC